jgi:flagellar biosynthesis/type III secretory pathway chaperone
MGKVDVVAALEDLLEAERALVLTGDVGALEQLAGRKEALLAALAGAEVTPAALERLRLGLDRNARVLSAAGQGIRDAIERVRQLADPAPLVTYDGQGRRSEIEAPSPSVSRSA